MKTKGFFICICMVAVGILTASCSIRETVEPDSISSSDFCLVFYCSGGDTTHTECMTDYKDAMEKLLPESGVAVTWILKSHNPDVATLRYYSDDGKFVTDEGWNGGTGYDISSPDNLAEFLQWSASRFPDRRYVLVTAGHGNVWRPSTDGVGRADGTVAYADPRGLLYDGTTGRTMAASDLSAAIMESGVDVEALLTNNCLQGSVETLAEWNGYVDYVVYGTSYVPDMGGDYPYLIKLMDRSPDLRSLLYDYVAHCGEFFNGIEYPFETGGSSLSVMEMKYFDPLMETVRKIFVEMGASLDRTSATTDFPCVYGRTFADGYRAAMEATIQMDRLDEPKTHDLYDFLFNAVLYTGHPELMTLVGEFRDRLNEAVLINVHNSGLDGHKLSFNICTYPEDLTGENLELYRTCRFDKATRWSDLYTTLFVDGE